MKGFFIEYIAAHCNCSEEAIEKIMKDLKIEGEPMTLQQAERVIARYVEKAAELSEGV